jgi:mono/diheme cytochrome c family protein
MRGRFLWTILILLAGAVLYLIGEHFGEEKYHHISGFAWSSDEWTKRSKGVRTSYNPDHDLSTTELTLVPGDPRWLDFVFWCFDNKVAEHQVEAYGGTEWEGPTGGVIFHWAPGSRWETHTLASFGFTIGHIIGEHKWMDTQFPELFENYGGVYGVTVKDRFSEIDSASPKPWVEFLNYIGGPNSPYYRYLFHQEVAIDPIHDKIYLTAGHGAGFEYTFERYYHELREVLTDARAFQFFQLYDLYGPGFASLGGWAKNKLAASLRGIYLVDDTSKWATKPGVAKPVKYNPNPPSPPIPGGIPDRELMVQGEALYKKQCAPCHGIPGDGKGFLAAGFEVKPRDFRQGVYKFTSTKSGELPTVEDIERTIRVGVPNTTMPAWGQFLTPEQIKGLARYLIVFSDRFVESWKEGRAPEKLPFAQAPSVLEALSSKGKSLYQEAGCWNCHGNSGKGDGPSAANFTDDWGNPVLPTDLTYKWTFKNGHSPQDVYRTMSAGFAGTPMPSYIDAYPDDQDRWALVAYVLSLSPKERPVLRLKDYKAGVMEISKRLDQNGRVIR